MTPKKNLTELFEAGKGTATCQKCRTNWKSRTMPEKCPFCGSDAILYIEEVEN